MPRAAERRPEADRHRIESWRTPVVLRRAEGRDAGALRRLAGLDSQPLPPGPFLVAERAGRLDAAISLSTGTLLADPFRRTAEIATLLRSHAGGVRVPGEDDRGLSRRRGVATVRARLVTT
jgi:hypothetical protein